MEQISLNITIEETNQILEVLGQMPYAKVFRLIEKIKAQAEAQLDAAGSSSSYEINNP